METMTVLATRSGSSPAPVVHSLNGRAEKSTCRPGRPNVGAESFGLLPHRPHEVRPLHALRETGKVLYLGGEHELAAGLVGGG